jgi:hypothetical protein
MKPFKMSTLGRFSPSGNFRLLPPSAVEPIEDFKDHTLENSSQFAKG